ncbi:hypothetical protein [Aeromicrobium wangtongii]|uniref:Uncharacterized protein n=1 Tax=Aeromicrobium wangtongii TaxID=2969247 RepID=A0ABY5MBC2_9ACTN|nr:hypothetical protein [Aeromicrobium wangtongii]MCD9196865.1 hypothetical protein [Aeromicrobium wangtongii]MCL3817831.1 hypothetical protein [Aeromicrobium wangtongii]UUP14373.1 hypothetical protein NQV15_03395 [Aeromicrobium wangtongii]
MTSALHRRAKAAVVAVAALAALSACSLDTFSASKDEPAPTATPAPAPTVFFDSQFTRDGTFQSHVDIDGVDFVYTLYPTKSTPRTNEWYPAGNKYFSFTFQAYDLDRDLRDPFKTKRKVYLDRIEVESDTSTTSGTVQSPYSLNAKAASITLDPEPLTSKYGMLITSPKGAFELRNQPIGDLAADTNGVNLTFRATVRIQRSPGSKSYTRETIRQKVPIAIFASDKPTEAVPIPVNAN